MQFFFDDLWGFALGVLLIIPLWLLPGFGIARIARNFGFSVTLPWQTAAWAILFSVSLLPVVDALLVRWLGIMPVIGIHIFLATVGINEAFRFLRIIPLSYYIFFLIWFIICVSSYADFDIYSRLNQSLIILDLVKHSATISSIAQHGLPLVDPFVARAQPAGYYYFYYVIGALVDIVGGSWVDGRMAFAATAFWTGIALPIALWQTGVASGFVRVENAERFFRLSVLVCVVAGLDLPMMLAKAWIGGPIEAQTDWWSEEVRFAATSVLWVPHHLTAVIAALAGAMLVEHSRTTHRFERYTAIVFAGLSFASAAGMSLWVALGAVPIFGIWAISLREGRRVGSLICAGSLAALFLIPQFWDLLAGRENDGMPLGLWVRDFGHVGWKPSWISPYISVLLLPFSWLLEFGIFALGAAAYLSQTPVQQLRSNAISWLMFVGLVVSLLLASFVRSAIINNDFGWRVIWFAQWPAMLWTVRVLDDLPTLRGMKPLWFACMIFGFAANLWDLAGLRWIRPPLAKTAWAFLNENPGRSFAMREALHWSNAKLPKEAIIQHNPASHHRIFDFGLYGVNRVWVADRDANLFGASRKTVEERMAAVAPAFDPTIPFGPTQRKSLSAHMDYLVVTDDDSVWKQRNYRFGPCLYKNSHVCIVALGRAARDSL